MTLQGTFYGGAPVHMSPSCRTHSLFQPALYSKLSVKHHNRHGSIEHHTGLNACTGLPQIRGSPGQKLVPLVSLSRAPKRIPSPNTDAGQGLEEHCLPDTLRNSLMPASITKGTGTLSGSVLTWACLLKPKGYPRKKTPPHFCEGTPFPKMEVDRELPQNCHLPQGGHLLVGLYKESKASQRFWSPTLRSARRGLFCWGGQANCGCPSRLP